MSDALSDLIRVVPSLAEDDGPGRCRCGRRIKSDGAERCGTCAARENRVKASAAARELRDTMLGYVTVGGKRKKPCSGGCGGYVSLKSSVCIPCRVRRRERRCEDCGVPVTRQSTRCISCACKKRVERQRGRLFQRADGSASAAVLAAACHDLDASLEARLERLEARVKALEGGDGRS